MGGSGDEFGDGRVDETLREEEGQSGLLGQRARHLLVAEEQRARDLRIDIQRFGQRRRVTLVEFERRLLMSSARDRRGREHCCSGHELLAGRVQLQRMAA